MKKSLLLVLGLALALSGCMPAFLQQTVNPTPAPNLEATGVAIGATMAAQTFEALQTSTPAPSNTPVVMQPTSTPTATVPPTATSLAAGTTTAGVSGTLVATIVTAGPATATSTLHAQFFGTLPPLVPSGRLILRNRSHAEAYVSFQCINRENTLSILEYPVAKWMEVKIPSGKCDYVAWVGGRQFLGKFSLDTGGQKMIIFYLDRILIK